MAIRFGAVALALSVLATGVLCAPADAANSGCASQADKFRSMMSSLSETQFHFVSAGSASASEKTAVCKSASDIADLRETLHHATLTGSDGVITTLQKIMHAKQLSVDQIVGIYVGPGGQITLFY